MSKEINYEDDELTLLMAQLEEETGVPVGKAPAPAPVVAAVSAGPVDPIDMDELEALEASLNGEIQVDTDQAGDANLAAALEAIENMPRTAPVVALPEATDDELEGLLAECAAMPAEEVPTITTLVEETPITVDDELAALEAGLNEDLAAPALAASMDAAIAGTSEALATGVFGDTTKEEFVEPFPLDVKTSSGGPQKMAIHVRGELPATSTEGIGQTEDNAGLLMSGGGDSALPPIVGMDFYVDPKKFNIDTRISDHELDRCMIEQNSLRAYYGSQAARAEAQHARIKLKFEILEAKLYDEHRRMLIEEGEKVTEKMVENRVKVDPKWFAGKSKVIDALAIAEINRALVESLRDRQSMLVQLGADRRDEMKGQLRTVASRDADSSLTARALQAALQK